MKSRFHDIFVFMIFAMFSDVSLIKTQTFLFMPDAGESRIKSRAYQLETECTYISLFILFIARIFAWN
jgi:hypothetical protein